MCMPSVSPLAPQVLPDQNASRKYVEIRHMRRFKGAVELCRTPHTGAKSSL